MKSFLLAALAIVLGGCEPPEPKQLLLIVPDGFRGPITIRLAPDGIEPQDIDRKCTLRIPVSGTLTITNGKCFEEMRTWTAEYQSGEKIKVYDCKDDEISLRGGGFRGRDSHEQYDFLIGTEAEYDRHLRRTDFPELDSPRPSK